MAIMKRFGMVLGLASLAVLGGAGRVEASKLTLTYWAPGTQFAPADWGSSILGQVDVTDGPPEDIQLTATWVAYGGEKPHSIGGPIRFDAYLHEGDDLRGSPIAKVSLTGAWAGHVIPRFNWGGEMSTAIGSGSAAVTAMKLSPGVDPSRIPSWLSGMHLTVEVGRAQVGGPPNLSRTTIVVSAVPVPEPGAAVVFLAVAGGGFVMARRRRR
jgi:hypothetical protein